MKINKYLTKGRLRFRTLARAVILCGIVPSLHASLVGHWFNGAANLTEVSGAHSAGTHDGVAIGSNAGALAYSTDVPAGFTGQSLNLIGNVGVSVSNSATGDAGYVNTFDDDIRTQCTVAFWAKGFPGTWAPWVSKRGEAGIGWQVRRMGGDNFAGYTIRGVDNEDGHGSTMNVNDNNWRHYAGVWDEATGTRKLYINGVLSSTVNNTIGQMMTLAANQQLVIGGRANGSGGFDTFFTGKLYDVRIYDNALTADNVLSLNLPPPVGLTPATGSGQVALTWSPITAATSYTVWTKNTNTNVETTDTTATASFTKTGLDNGTTYLFKVKATNGAVEGDYSAEISATPALSPAKDILSFSFGLAGNGTISGTNITKYMPIGTNVTALAPTYTTSAFSTSSPASGTTLDFTFPQSYTITAENGTTKTYTVTVSLVSNVTYDFNTGLQGWAQLWPTTPAILLQNNALGSGYDGIPPTDDILSRHARSPVFYLLGSGPLTFDLSGGQSPMPSPHVGPSAIPEEAIDGGGFAGVALRDVATDTYVLSRRKSANGGAFVPHEFTAAELAPFANDGKQYTLDYLDYNRGGWGWTYMDNVSIPGTTVAPGTEALLTGITIGSQSITEITGTNVKVWLPHGTNVTALNPFIAISPGATISPSIGTVRDFTTPQAYTVTSGDTLASNVYTVTVLPAGSLSVKTYDTIADQVNLAPISTLMAQTPSATSVQLGEIIYGNFAASLPGITANESFSVLWEGWFDVTKDGPGIYTFGTQSDDGSMIYLDLNDDGDFDDAMELVVNNNGDHEYDIRTASVYLPMDRVRIAIGYYELGGGEGIDVRFNKGNNLAFPALQRVGGLTGHYRIAQPATIPSSSALWYLNDNGTFATQNVTNLLLTVPYDPSGVTAVAPEFLISPGATCVPPSGTVRDFTTPQTYAVTSQDNSTTTVYTVTVVQNKIYNFNTGNLDGWRNRVWDLSANSGAGGWIDLAPNATTMPATINAGVLQPASVDNGLYTVAGGELYPTGQTDNHLNTLWVHSPAFYLDALRDITLQVRRGMAHTTDPADEAAVPFAAVTNAAAAPPGGWKGAVLRRASDGAFLLAKPAPGPNGDGARTITFTQAELAPFDGVACTIGIINSDRGGWGWLSVDNVDVPISGFVPVSPYDTWRAQHPLLVGSSAAPGADADSDSITNLMEFGLGTDPGVSSPGPMSYVPAGDFTTPGQPVMVVDGSTRYAVFGRRNTYVEDGLSYTIQFSADLISWENSMATPTLQATNFDMEAFSVPFPATIAPGVQPRFFRLAVTQN